jgi:hypothetical protein
MLGGACSGSPKGTGAAAVPTAVTPEGSAEPGDVTAANEPLQVADAGLPDAAALDAAPPDAAPLPPPDASVPGRKRPRGGGGKPAGRGFIIA